MRIAERVRLLLTALVAGLGLVATGLTLGLPWLEPEFRLGPAIRVIMALAGASILIMAAWPGPIRSATVRRAVLLLGIAVLIYPTALSLMAAGRGGDVVAVLAAGGHVLPLTLVQLLPVLASQEATGRSRRRWLLIIVGVPIAGLVDVLLVLQGMSGGLPLATISSVLWFGSFALAPVATWTNVTGLCGARRRRAIVAALASVLPVVIIAWCLTLGAAADVRGFSEGAAMTALMVGFSLCTLGAAVLAVAVTGPENGPLLRRRVVVVLLALLLTSATSLLGVGASLAVLAAGGSGVIASLVGIALVIVLGLVAVRLYAWASRAVDPAAELAGGLAGLGPVPDGEHRQSLQQVLRRTVGDAGLVLLVRAGDGSWLDPQGVVVPALPPAAQPVAGPADCPEAVVVELAEGSATRLAGLGDCAALVRPAVLEATALQETRRADAAAAAERARLSQDLHDGLQGRLLGIALNLQLSGREVDDPAARLLVEQTVDSLRDAVDDVRALGGGRLPTTLVDGGLGPALADLVRPLAAVVDLEVPERRFAPHVEATSYFVVGEAISNAIKHGRAGSVRVRLTTATERLTIMVSDDGVGGADPRLGSGLRGLSERVAASGGMLVVRDGVPTGTVVEAVVPCGS